MTRNSSSNGTVVAIIGFILPSFLFLWTGVQTVSLYLAGGYFYLLGYGEIQWWVFSDNDFALQFFNLNWYLNPSNIYNASEGVDGILEALAVAIYPGDFGHSTLDISGLLFGFSLILIVAGIAIGFSMKNQHKFSGLLFISGASIALISLFLIWVNATGLTIVGNGVEENFIPIPLGSLIILGAGIWNLRQS